MRRCLPGFTLYELLITLALLAVLVSIAVPSFAVFLTKSRQTIEINSLFHGAHLARKESIMRRKVVSLCPSSDGLQCSGTLDWSVGWLMFANTDADSPPRVDTGETILKYHKVASAVRLSANRRGFTWRATVKRATNGTLVACDRHDRVAPKALVVSYTGRPRVALRRPNGRSYDCSH
jgi:type IV fimbrial biogenesis protein FimT